MRVCLDPGHGGRDTGARTADGRQEKETNLTVALKVEALLKMQGFNVLMTRRDDTFLTIADRCKLANDWKADVFLSLHADAAEGPDAHGRHAIHSIHRGRGQKLARLLVDEVERATGRKPFPASSAFFGGPGDGTWSRKGKSDPTKDFYGVIRGTAMPAVILERGFLTNPDDARLLFDGAHLDRQAEGIARGVCAYFGAPFRADTPAPQPPSETRPTPQAPGVTLNVALCRPEDLDVAVPTKWATLTEIAKEWGPIPGPPAAPQLPRGRHGQIARASNANLFTDTKALGLVWSGGQFAGQDQWACWNWPVLAVYGDGRAEILPEGWTTPDLTGLQTAVAGAPLLVRDRQTVDIPAAMRAAGIDTSIRPNERIPRTAVGVRGDGLIVHAVTEAATLSEVAAAMLAADCLEALALDGGGSTGLVEGGKLVAGQDARKLPCALVIRQTAQAPATTPPPRNPVAEIRRLIDRGALPAGTYEPRFPFSAGELAPLLNDMLDRLDRLGTEG